MSTTTVTSEALQLKLRQLLPSQQGFGTDLSASDTIIPIIDLTAAAEGSDVPQNLQTALAFGSQTEFSVRNANTVIGNTPGFYRIIGVASLITSGGSTTSVRFDMSDGVTTKTVWSLQAGATATHPMSESYDFIAFLASGESINAVTNTTGSFNYGSIRQIADVNGALTNPSGFSPQ
jgi:hypothetical protein